MFTTVASRNAMPDASTVARRTQRPVAVPHLTASLFTFRTFARRTLAPPNLRTHAPRTPHPAPRTSHLRTVLSPNAIDVDRLEDERVRPPLHHAQHRAPEALRRRSERRQGLHEKREQRPEEDDESLVDLDLRA